MIMNYGFDKVEINKYLKDWNVIIEALGRGKQSIIVRKYRVNKNDFFLLYPTKNYLKLDNIENYFKKDYVDFFKRNQTPYTRNNQIEIHYCAEVEKIFTISSLDLPKLSKFLISEINPIEEYLNYGEGYVWVLRVYWLEEPIRVNIAKDIVYDEANKKIDMNGLMPVLSNDKFDNILLELDKI